jgi:hypothetical protein
LQRMADFLATYSNALKPYHRSTSLVLSRYP